MIQELLTSLKMTGALEALPRLEETKDKHQFLAALLKAEKEHRELRANKRRLSSAKFPMEKEWQDIDHTLNPQIDFKKIEQLSIECVQKKENICFMGQQGTGKTHSLIALGKNFCRKGISTKFYTACDLVNLLEEAKANYSLCKQMQHLSRPQLLVIDELGFIPFSENGARLLFDVFASRYEKGSIAVSTNLSFEKWLQIFGTPELTAALIDRFTHRCHIFTFEGKSVRLMEAKKRRAEKENKRTM